MRNWIPVEAVFHAPEASVTARILQCRASLSSDVLTKSYGAVLVP
ncbi:hypothetical protein T4B_8808 [Trichinella pseudospiralis]|uniref:Uncharacterized protein n=1 Tax=Trichinella pseudospiralis TaxID=6337 RepID=A0A0V1E354_TRIPS|nr:hypothetical protein T4A_5780 [Trichinella pseudospiralis]KRZ23640.1 hypothetical protein T4B_8808 [Trichinella pseudospiralis]